MRQGLTSPLDAAGIRDEHGAVDAVSPREEEILDLLGTHLTNAEIATKLFISVRTVESHVSSLLRKLRAEDRRELGARAAERAADGGRAKTPTRTSPLASPAIALPDLPRPIRGRDSDLQAVAKLARDHRIVTITGPGGVGKTRTLVELGHMLAADFDGVAFISLAHVVEPTEFVGALGAALDVKEAEDRTLAKGLAALLEGSTALLLLDNFEQIVAAAPDVAALVTNCPGLHVVVSSRAPLRLGSEQEYQLEPLDVPPASSANTVEAISAYPAVTVFVERARSTQASFALTAANAGAVADVCRRLDGLPLALELAAYRLRVLSPDALLERLDHALDVLTTGPRDTPQRQQTLRATIDWSHSLLSDSEQRLFRRIAGFAGGCTAADVEAVCLSDGASGLDDLESLTDKGLLQVDRRNDRLRLLETVREYALERLNDAGETHDLASRHALWFANVAREIRTGIEGGDQVAALATGVANEDNLLAALECLLTASTDDPDASAVGLAMCGDLWLYWHIRGKHLTARKFSSGFLDAGPPHPSAERAAALVTAGLASWTLGDFERANDELSEAHRLATDFDAPHTYCVAGLIWGLPLMQIDLEKGLQVTGESIDRGHAVGYEFGEAFAASIDAILQTVAGNVDVARARYAHALRIQQRLDDHEGAGLTLSGLAALAAERGDIVEALDLYWQSLAAFEAINDRAEEARVLTEVGWTHLSQGAAEPARQFFLNSVRAYSDVASVRGVGLALLGLASTQVVEGRPALALTIAAAAEVYAHREGIVNVYSPDTPGGDFLDRARVSLSADEASQATARGQTLTIGQALDLASAH